MTNTITVLHVDDEPSFTELTVSLLEREDDRFAVETATSASAGLEIIRDRSPDCVVSDYDMPGMDGIEFLEVVREDHPDLPFFLFTGKGSEEVASDAISAGATDYLQKQSGTEQYELLANRVRNAVSKARSQRTERYLRELSEATDHILYAFTRDWSELLFVNSAYEEIWGRSVEALRADPLDFLEGVSPDDRERVREAIERMSDGETIDIECRIDATEDFDRWARIRGEPIRDDDGELVRVAGFVTEITDQRRQRQEIREYQQLVDSLPDPAAVFDAEGRYELANQALAELRGASVGEMTGRQSPHLRRIQEQGDGNPLEALLAGDREEVRGEYAAEFDDGNERVFEYRFTPIDGDEGTGKIAGVSRDITERKERERDLVRYERLLESLPVGVFRTTFDGEIVDMNGALRDIYNAESRAQLREAGVRELYLDASERDRLLERLQQTGRVENELLEVETLDGDRRVVRTTLTLTEEDGTRYLDGIVEDVTERRELERQFEQIRTIAESLNDAVYVVDENGRFTYVNDQFVSLVGYSKETIRGSTPALIKGEEAVEQAERELGQLLSSEGPDTTTFEVTIHPREGDPIVCEDHMGVLPYEGDMFNGSVGVLRDITERKRRERELRRERDRLDEFVSVVSHDLRNPLSVAEGNLELLAEECDSDRIEQIARAHGRMDTLIDDLLTLAREGERVGDTEPADLEDLSKTCWRTVASPGASLHVEASRTIRCDPSRLRQLFENLYRNAIEHGGREVTVVVGATENGFYVGDDGPGIAEGEREEVFDPGYSTSEDGTGFGLRIVKQVADAHGWTVRVTESETGGARFEVTGVDFEW